MKILCLASVLCTSALQVAAAQSTRTAQPITAPVRDAGVLHLTTHTWTRHSQAMLVGPNTIYDNTCPSGFFSPLSGDTYVDEGRVPSSTARNPQGCATSYLVNGFQIGYCTSSTSMGTYTVNVYQSYVPCATVIGVTPTASLPLTGLPASGVTGTATCWTVTIDLTAPGSNLPFTMLADSDGSSGGGLDTFGWSMSSTVTSNTGPMIAGDPNTCAFGAGTEWSTQTGAGTGLGNQDLFRIEGGSTAAGCYFFGGTPNPYGGFHLRLLAETCAQEQDVLCNGDGIAPHTACPCGNNTNPHADAGCNDSFGIGGVLRSSGTASIGNDSLTLLGSAMPNTSSCLYFQGTVSAGAGSAFGDGLRCATGTVLFLGTKLCVGGVSHWPGTGDPSISVQGMINAPGTRIYQIEYRNMAPFCTSNVFNTSNGLQVLWTP